MLLDWHESSCKYLRLELPLNSLLLKRHLVAYLHAIQQPIKLLLGLVLALQLHLSSHVIVMLRLKLSSADILVNEIDVEDLGFAASQCSDVWLQNSCRRSCLLKQGLHEWGQRLEAILLLANVHGEVALCYSILIKTWLRFARLLHYVQNCWQSVSLSFISHFRRQDSTFLLLICVLRVHAFVGENVAMHSLSVVSRSISMEVLLHHLRLTRTRTI